MAQQYTFMAKPDSYNAYAAGNKIYGLGGRSAPNVGQTLDPTGYINRDAEVRLKRNALLRRLKAGAKKDYMNPDFLGGLR